MSTDLLVLATGVTIRASAPTIHPALIAPPAIPDTLVVPVAGPRGLPGVALVHDQPAPAGSWLINHAFGRWPDVAVYDLTGQRIEPDITVGDTAVTVSFATPTAGKAVLL